MRAGKEIMRDAADHLTQVSLELGGKAPFIVLEDADVDMAARNAVTSRFMNCGQVCICNERTLVAESVFDRFVERFVDLIPTVIDQNPCAHLRMPRDMIFHGWSMRLFQAWQHSATMSS